MKHTHPLTEPPSLGQKSANTSTKPSAAASKKSLPTRTPRNAHPVGIGVAAGVRECPGGSVRGLGKGPDLHWLLSGKHGSGPYGGHL